MAKSDMTLGNNGAFSIFIQQLNNPPSANDREHLYKGAINYLQRCQSSLRRYHTPIEGTECNSRSVQGCLVRMAMGVI